MSYKTQYELYLFRDAGDYIVDLREDTVTEYGDNIDEEYKEGFIFYRYDEALTKFYELVEKYEAKEGELLMWNEMEEPKQRASN